MLKSDSVCEIRWLNCCLIEFDIWKVDNHRLKKLQEIEQRVELDAIPFKMVESFDERFFKIENGVSLKPDCKLDRSGSRSNQIQSKLILTSGSRYWWRQNCTERRDMALYNIFCSKPFDEIRVWSQMAIHCIWKDTLHVWIRVGKDHHITVVEQQIENAQINNYMFEDFIEIDEFVSIIINAGRRTEMGWNAARKDRGMKQRWNEWEVNETEI